MSSRRGTRRAAPVATAGSVVKAKKVEDTMTKYESDFLGVTRDTTELIINTTEVDGLKCVCTAQYGQFDTTQFSWKFNWGQLRTAGIDRISGVIYGRTSFLEPFQIDVDMTGDDTFKRTTNYPFNFAELSVCFAYNLTLHRSKFEQICYDEMFLPSEQNDTVLIVDGKKLHVNKAFLSYHSEFFRALFSSNFKEGQMDEIPIKDISFEDFGLLMSTIYPKTQFPNDMTAEKLLELADRFLIPSVIGHVEYQLLHNTEIENGQLMLMADKYDMPKLFEKCIQGIDTVRSAK